MHLVAQSRSCLTHIHSQRQRVGASVRASVCLARLLLRFELIAVVPSCYMQAKEALKHPYFDDMDKVAVDALENPELENFAD